ncbi:hypothetical protein JXB02_00140 [Candidatus Woesearchaeota archaeon]|nr:hypothetical protein [Candidatus Woesearchaeota archaeon]
MRVTHRIHSLDCAGESESPSFLLSNKRGGYFSITADESPSEANSRYEGLHLGVAEKDGFALYKTVESIYPLGITPTEAVVRPGMATRKYDAVLENFHFQRNSLIYEIQNFDGEVALLLDCRGIYDFDDKDRNYTIRRKGKHIVIEYRKYRFDPHNDYQKRLDYTLYVVIHGAGKYREVGEWKKRWYPYEERRGSPPSELWVYDALRFRSDRDLRLVVSVGMSENEAVLESEYFAGSAGKLKEYLARKEQRLHSLIPKRMLDEYEKKLRPANRDLEYAPDPEMLIAYLHAIDSLDGLIIRSDHQERVFAGFPWFFQVWTRDEAICLKALLNRDQTTLVKDIINRHLKEMRPDGRVPSRFPVTSLGSADGVGWVFRRLFDLVKKGKQAQELERHISLSELAFFADILSYSLKHLEKHHTTADGFATNGPLETWMDTNADSDTTRSGIRVEICALRLAMYNLRKILAHLLKNDEDRMRYEHIEQVLLGKTRNLLFDGSMLADGFDTNLDRTVRPNVFLAHYIYPKLLAGKEWEKVIEGAIRHLWLEWGGFATIDRKSRYFCPRHTGQDNRSYHLGDSWYFVNNIAALVMLRTNARLFSARIRHVMLASANDILYQGFLGHPSEVSDAERQSPGGCLCQAWSAATFAELFDEAFR